MIYITKAESRSLLKAPTYMFDKIYVCGEFRYHRKVVKCQISVFSSPSDFSSIPTFFI